LADELTNLFWLQEKKAEGGLGICGKIKSRVFTLIFADLFYL